jgi:hypothetical protein
MPEGSRMIRVIGYPVEKSANLPDLHPARLVPGGLNHHKDHVRGVGLAFNTENAPAPRLLDSLHRTGIFGNLYIGSQ